VGPLGEGILFVVNALCWPAAGQNGKTGLNSEMHKLGPMLPKNNLQWTRTDLLVSDLKVFCCHSLTDVNVKKIVECAVEGGGLPIGKQPWGWEDLNLSHGSYQITDIPG
uniref:Uncharacterized protein n=1 Tax=Theropithecus gelada TaxID=9565 RepID=A0A8D2E4K1_THEGE